MDDERRGKDGPPSGEKIHDLVDVVEERPLETAAGRDLPLERDERAIREIRDVTEQIARELIPGIVERVIREEIEKLKKAGG